MHSRAFRILLLLLVGVWYAAVLPGHQRGVVQLAGARADGCCEHPKPHRPGEPARAPNNSPLNCAVCAYMGALQDAPPPELGIAPLGRTDEQLADRPPEFVSLRLIPAYLGRAPPLA